MKSIPETQTLEAIVNRDLRAQRLAQELDRYALTIPQGLHDWILRERLSGATPFGNALFATWKVWETFGSPSCYATSLSKWSAASFTMMSQPQRQYLFQDAIPLLTPKSRLFFLHTIPRIYSNAVQANLNDLIPDEIDRFSLLPLVETNISSVRRVDYNRTLMRDHCPHWFHQLEPLADVHGWAAHFLRATVAKAHGDEEPEMTLPSLDSTP